MQEISATGLELGLSAEEFAGILQEICGRYLGPEPSEAERMRFCRTLQLEDLALAHACAKGNEAAWERFISRYRPKLREAALAIVKEESRARELADSLYASLFGTPQNSATRVSKFASYTGRGSLEAWLRTLLAQEYVNKLRRERRLVAFDEDIENRAQSSPYARNTADPRVVRGIEEALATLAAEERVVLAAYYLDGCTLAQIGRLIGSHESTISRRIDKLTRCLRKRILQALQRQGMSARQGREAMDCDVRDLGIDVRSKLMGGKIAARSKS